VARVLDSTLELLAERGYAGVSLEEVGRRAGVNKTTVYRRWPTRVALVCAALKHKRERGLGLMASSGDLRRDMIELAKRQAEWIAQPLGRAILLAIITADEPEVRQIAQELRAHTEERDRQMLEAPIARGELRDLPNPAAVLGSVFGQMLLGSLVLREQPSAQEIEQAVDLVLDGARVRHAPSTEKRVRAKSASGARPKRAAP
jgi:AcrR family transcriptional regulator